MVPNWPIRPEILETLQVAAAVPPGRPHRTRALLEIPLDVALFVLRCGPPLSWIPYTFELVGTHPPPAARYERFFFQHDLLAAYGALTITIWSRRVYLALPGVAVEIRWQPDSPAHYLLSAPTHLDPRTAAKHLVPGLRLLQDLHGGGAPPGPRLFATRDAFLQTLTPIIHGLQAQGQYASQALVVELFPFKTTTRQLQRWLQDFGLSWADVQQRA
jgi:hypothetical protein